MSAKKTSPANHLPGSRDLDAARALSGRDSTDGFSMVEKEAVWARIQTTLGEHQSEHHSEETVTQTWWQVAAGAGRRLLSQWRTRAAGLRRPAFSSVSLAGGGLVACAVAASAIFAVLPATLTEREESGWHQGLGVGGGAEGFVARGASHEDASLQGPGITVRISCAAPELVGEPDHVSEAGRVARGGQATTRRCQRGSTLALQADRNTGYMMAFAQDPRGQIHWYLAQDLSAGTLALHQTAAAAATATATAKAKATATHTPTAWMAIDPGHPTGRYTLYTVFADRPLSRAEIRARLGSQPQAPVQHPSQAVVQTTFWVED